MSKKNKPDSLGFVFSTNPNFKFEEEEQTVETLAPNKQKLRVWLDTKKRAGKVATLITGFIGTAEDLEELGKKLKNFLHNFSNKQNFFNSIGEKSSFFKIIFL